MLIREQWLYSGLGVSHYKHQTESKSEALKACRETKLVDTQKKAVNKPPRELQKSECTKCTPIQDDDLCFSIISYSKGNLLGKIKVPLEKALIINDSITYEEAMSKSDATH